MDKTKRKSVTMADIAGALGISKNAVSLALNDKPGVSDLLRIQVREMAEQMQYGAPSPLPQRDDRLCIVVLVPEYIRD
ncbi:MAG: helix-turn-helix domain-containing protein, partial [Clostridia bacterium]